MCRLDLRVDCLVLTSQELACKWAGLCRPLHTGSSDSTCRVHFGVWHWLGVQQAMAFLGHCRQKTIQ
jgi:hypothetical protein